ncbi:hypothetical protein [Baekduia soli]|nr:hypothetical protein [Baekduia soli]
MRALDYTRTAIRLWTLVPAAVIGLMSSRLEPVAHGEVDDALRESFTAAI